MKPEEFFLKVFDEKQGDTGIQQLIATYLENRRAKVLALLKGKMILKWAEMGSLPGNNYIGKKKSLCAFPFPQK